VEHAIETAGIDHVAIGSDRTFFPTWKPSPLDWTNWPYWTVGLVCKGLPDADIQKIIGANYLRYAERVLDKRPWGAVI
jgi:membrane dipeptidase